MKKHCAVLVMSALAVLSMLSMASCTKEPSGTDEPDPDPQEKEEDKPQPGVYTFTASPLKGKWEPGDQIFVHGAYGPAAQTITLSAADISGDGLTASATLDKVMEYPLTVDYFYAVWPGEAVPENDGMMTSSVELSISDKHIAVAYLKDKNFAFADASSCLTFNVSGYSDFAFSGNERPGVRYTSFKVTYTSKESKFAAKNDGYPFIYGECSDKTVKVWFPGTVTFDKGITLYLGTDGNWTKSYSITDDVKINAGEVKELGDITSSLSDYSGPAPKVPEMGDYKKMSINISELSSLCLSPDKDFLYAVGDEGDLAKISFDFKLYDMVHIGGDCEAVDVDPVTRDLIVGTEPNTVYRVPAPDYNKRVNLFSIASASSYGNAGQEGLTYYKDGMIYCGMQTASDLYRIDLETGEVLWRSKLREVKPYITEIADLCYDPLTDWLWIIDSEAKKMFALTGDAQTLIASYSVKVITNPESICVDHANSCIWVADDYGDVSYLYKYNFTGLDDAIINKK